MAQPALALSLLQELGLAPAVYNPPENLVPPPPEEGFDWARGTAVARAATRLLAFRSNKSGVLGERLLVAGVAQGADSTTGCAERVARKMGAVGVGMTEGTPRAQTCDETREGEEPSVELEATVSATLSERRGRLGQEGEEGSGDARKTEAPATLLRELFLSAALLPLRGVKHKAKKGKLVPAALSVVGDSLKVSGCSWFTGRRPNVKALMTYFIQFCTYYRYQCGPREIASVCAEPLPIPSTKRIFLFSRPLRFLPGRAVRKYSQKAQGKGSKARWRHPRAIGDFPLAGRCEHGWLGR